MFTSHFIYHIWTDINVMKCSFFNEMWITHMSRYFSIAWQLSLLSSFTSLRWEMSGSFCLMTHTIKLLFLDIILIKSLCNLGNSNSQWFPMNEFGKHEKGRKWCTCCRLAVTKLYLNPPSFLALANFTVECLFKNYCRAIWAMDVTWHTKARS